MANYKFTCSINEKVLDEDACCTFQLHKGTIIHDGKGLDHEINFNSFFHRYAACRYEYSIHP